MRDLLMRIMRFHIVFSMVSRFSGLGSFWVSFESLGSTFGSHVAPIEASVGPLCGLLVSWASSWDPLGTHLVLSWVILCPLGSLVSQICAFVW